MSKTYTIASPAAIVGGVAASAGATALLVRDAFATGWTVELALMPVLVGLTILSAHVAWGALRSGRVISAVGLYALAVLGSGLIVYEQMGRRAETRDVKMATVTASVTQRQHAEQMLREAEEILAKHRAARDSECASGKGKKCDGLGYTVSTWEAAVAGHEVKLAKLGPDRPIDSRADRIAGFAALFGLPPGPAKNAVALFEPVALPLFLELGSILLFGYGLGRVRAREKPDPAIAPVPKDEPIAPIANDNRKGPIAKADALQDLQTLLKIGQTVPSQDWLKDRWQLSSKGTVSKWVSEWETDGVIPHRMRAGKCNTLEAA